MNKRQAALQIKKVLRDNSFDRYVISKRGSIDFNRLQFYKTSKRLFREQAAEWGKHYAFVLMLDVSGSMWHAACDWSRLSKSYNTLRNIVGLLKDFVKIDIVLFSEDFYHMTANELMAFKSEQEFDRFIYTWIHGVPYWNPDTKVLNIKTKKQYWGCVLYSLGWLTNEPPAFQYAYTLLKNFKWKTGIISVCDWDNNCDHITDWLIRWRDHLTDEENLRLDLTSRKFTPQINWIDTRKYWLNSFKRNIKLVSEKIDYVLWVWLWTDYPERNYDNFIRIDNANDIYIYIVKMMRLLMH